MADDKRAASDPLKNQDDPRMDEFKKAPDQWKEVAKLKFGGDRTAASSLQTLIMDADVSQYPALEKKLLDVLANKDTTNVGADFACRMLRLVGTPASVPALSKLLADEKTANFARYALQLIPGAEVDAPMAKLMAEPKAQPKSRVREP